MSNNQSGEEKNMNSISIGNKQVNEASEETKNNSINLNNVDKKKKYKEMFTKLKDKIIKTLKSEKEKFNELEDKEKYNVFKKFVREFREKNEEELFRNQSEQEKERYKIKENEIKEIIESLNIKKCFSSEDVLKIKNFTLTENGFLKNEYRKYFYKFLFIIDNKNNESNKYLKQIKLLYKDHKDEKKYYKKLFNIYRKDGNYDNYKDSKPSEHNLNNNCNGENYISIFKNYKQVKYDNIIEVDVKRTIFNSIFNKSERDQVMLEYMKEKISQKLKNFFSLDEIFKYYQGFHDIAIFIYVLILSENEEFIDEKEEAEENDDILLYEILQRLAEFYLKDYLAEITTLKYDNNGEVINTTKSAFKFENIYRIINDIKKNIDNNIFQLIQNKSDFPDPIYTLPWALTFFTHDIKNINIIYRILDFVLFEHPVSIYYIAANVIYLN